MKQFVLEYLARELALAGNGVVTLEHHTADLHIRLKDGRTVAVYVINRALRLPEIRETLERNSVLRLHTLYIVDQRLLPAHQSEGHVAYWMAALHTLGDGRIYTYQCDRRDVTIMPLHIDWKWGDGPRRFEYGPAVQVSGLRASVQECSSKHIAGLYSGADFGDAPFWKKRTPLDDMNQRYSWRNFSYQSRKRRAQAEPDEAEAAWDAWEHFEQHYGDTGEYYSGGTWQDDARQRARSGGAGRGQAGYEVVDSAHYRLLGVNIGATLDEVKSAYRRKARENHPDLHPPQQRPEYTAKMVAINAAFEAIRKSLAGE